MYNIYNTIGDIGDLDIANGETRRMNCPSCRGYKTFTVTNNMGSIMWNCYKVSCNLSGSSRVKLSADDIRTSFTGGINKEEKDDVFVLPSSIMKHGNRTDVIDWCSHWGIDADELNLLYDVKDNRVVFPVVQNNIMVDATGRSLGNKIPKWKRYGNSGLPYSFGYGSVAVVVEDCVSAAVVGSDVLVGVAVLGTSLSESHKRYLMQFSTAIIALDPDALTKTLAFAKELRGYVPDVRVLRLIDDLKYRNPNDISNLHSIGV